MSKSKYTYQSYDYSFLCDHPTNKWYIKLAQKVVANTIGFDLDEVRPMDEPVGQLFWFDSVAPTDTTDDTTYEPMHTGGWEIRLTPPVTVTETPVTATTVTYTQESDAEPVINNTWWQRGPIRPPKYIRSATQMTRTYNQIHRRRNYLRNVIARKHGKKV